MSRHQYETTLSFGTDGEADYAEVDVTVSFSVSWGAPEQGPSYASGGQPADPDEIDDIRLEKVGGKPAPWNLHFHSDKHFAALCVEMIEGSEAHLEAMLIEAHKQEVADYEDAMERRWAERREASL